MTKQSETPGDTKQAMHILDILAFDDGILAECSIISTKQRMTVEPATFGRARLGIGDPAFEGYYDDVWDFPNWQSALHAMRAWDPERSPEPSGWHRHFRTGRYRINGDESLEYVRSHGSTDDQVRHAVNVTQGQARIINEVVEKPEHIGPWFPQGTRFFSIISESSQCDHSPRCHWQDIVYHYIDHCVVLSASDMLCYNIDNIVWRLTSGLDRDERRS